MPARHPSFALQAGALTLAAAAAGCAGLVPPGGLPTGADLLTITPGMTRQQVVERFGRPAWVFGVRQENLTILNYRPNHSDCTIYQVSVRPDGIVRDVAPAWDPGCDGPSGRD